MKRRIILCFVLLQFQFGCTSDKVYAPVTDATIIDPIPKSGTHRVQRGESLYSIAWRYGIDSRRLAQRNHFSRPYSIHTGQMIYLKGQPSAIVSTPVKVVLSAPQHSTQRPQPLIECREPTAPVSIWRWPAKGPVIAGFADLNKGINIGGHYGDPIFATAAGRVVYCGNGLRGYGNLIIIEHNRTYLTAYAHNSKLLVKEGQWIKSGQIIAQMGDSGTRRVMLHFEIRREGKPVNPMTYLRN